MSVETEIKKEVNQEINQEEKEEESYSKSIYNRIKYFVDDERAERAEKSFNEGKYETMEEAFKKTPRPNCMSVVKHICFKRQIPNSSLETKIEAIRYTVTHIMRITPEQFFSIYSTDFNKKFYLYPTINTIVNSAPNETWKDCYFNSKYIFFKMVWPDVYERLATKFDCLNIYYCKDDFKSSLKHAGAPAVSSRKSAGKGADVDEILFTAICDTMYDKLDFDTMEEIFNMLATDSKEYFDSKKAGRNKLNTAAPGICEVIEARGYGSLYDFFYLKLPTKTQIDYADDFLTIRKKYGLPSEPVLENAIEAVLETKVNDLF